jgi:hypothetical protein
VQPVPFLEGGGEDDGDSDSDDEGGGGEGGISAKWMRNGRWTRYWFHHNPCIVYEIYTI